MNGKAKLFTLVVVLAALRTSYFFSNEMKYRVPYPDEIQVVELDESKVFLLEAENGYLLFDTGYPWDFEAFGYALDEKNIEMSSIRYVFLSHAHDDHVGFINDLVAHNPTVKVIVHEKSVQLLAKGKNNKDNGGGLFNRRALFAFRVKQQFKRKWDLTFPPYQVRDQDIVIRGEVSDLPEEIGINGKIILTPGHTSDSISLLYNDTYLLCGDLTATAYNLIGGNQLTVFNENVDEVYASWRRIIGMDIPYIVPSHGSPFRTEKLKEYIDRVEQKDLVSFF